MKNSRVKILKAQLEKRIDAGNGPQKMWSFSQNQKQLFKTFLKLAIHKIA